MKMPQVKASNINDRPNQFEIITDKGRFFQSYRTIIVFINNKGERFLDKNSWNYSHTTSRYRNQFLNETIAETREKIKSGEYKLTNLNR